MSYNKKISVVILGNGKSLKEALITNMTGKDLSALYKADIFRNTCVYETETHKFICTPDLTSFRELPKLLSGHHDMCLLVVECGFEPSHVLRQIEDLEGRTKKPKDNFIVVLPFQQDIIDAYPFKSYTMEQLFRKLEALRHLEQTKRPMYPQQHTFEEHTGRQGGLQANADKYPASYMDQMRGYEFSGQPHNALIYSNKTGKHTVPTLNLVLVGMSGTGKSASGNTILGKKCFHSVASSTPVTTECQAEETVISGAHVRVIDTPDIYRDNIKSSVPNRHVTMCRKLCGSGPCLYLLVIQIGRFTDGERNILQRLEENFDTRVREKTILLLTHGEDLRRGKMSLSEYLGSCGPELKKTLNHCGGRFVVFENSSPDTQQAENLLQIINRK